MKLTISENNFDLIRLFAASQVAVLHVADYLARNEAPQLLVRLLEAFPGVPIFFFISGFLITRSFEKNSRLSEYGRNRALRIFPALHVCVLLNLIFVIGTGYVSTTDAGHLDVIVLYLAKTTFFQFYNPDFMRGFGDGVLNGSLWTICVELQFYLLVPIIYWAFVAENKTRSDAVLLVVLIGSIVCNRTLYHLEPEFRSTAAWKLARVSFLPWIYMFIAGMLVQRNFDVISRWLCIRWIWLVLPIYLGYCLVMQKIGARMDNGVSPLVFFPLAAATLVTAYSRPGTARRLLSGNDISYGIYIYHAPIMNMYLYFGLAGAMFVGQTLILTLIFAIASWFAVERPCLRRKRHPVHSQ